MSDKWRWRQRKQQQPEGKDGYVGLQHHQVEFNFHETALGRFNFHETALGRFNAVAAAAAVAELVGLLWMIVVSAIKATTL